VGGSPVDKCLIVRPRERTGKLVATLNTHSLQRTDDDADDGFAGSSRTAPGAGPPNRDLMLGNHSSRWAKRIVWHGVATVTALEVWSALAAMV
jgi:hypothetical protein